MYTIYVEEILAVGTRKSFAWFVVNGKTFCVFISRDLYYALKDLGVPTSQFMYHHK